jgi:hypothetical protein
MKKEIDSELERSITVATEGSGSYLLETNKDNEIDNRRIGCFQGKRVINLIIFIITCL